MSYGPSEQHLDLCFRVHVSANTYVARSVGVINDNIVHALCQVEK